MENALPPPAYFSGSSSCSGRTWRPWASGATETFEMDKINSHHRQFRQSGPFERVSSAALSRNRVKLHPRPDVRRYDRFETNETDGGATLHFVVMEMHEHGLFGGSLVEATDKHCVGLRWIEEISVAEIAEKKWRLVSRWSIDESKSK
jgi:hypothetical protein